jgi:flagellar biosynthesis/type III secretory pathway M-ring protein FliF/YscJ
MRGIQRNLRPQPIATFTHEITAPTDPRTALLEEVSRANGAEMDDKMLGLETIGPPMFDAKQQAAAEKAQMLRQLQLMAKNRPETLAQIIEFWMAEDKEKP